MSRATKRTIEKTKPYICSTVEAAVTYAAENGYPMKVGIFYGLNRPPTTANSLDELREMATEGIRLSPTSEIQLTPMAALAA